MTDEPQNPAPGATISPSKRPSLKGAATALLLASIVAVLGYLALSDHENVAVQATCEDAAGGYSCTLTGDNRKPATLDVCWSIRRTCENGVKSSASKCQSIHFEPGQASKSIFESSAFENSEQCDKVASFAIEDVNVGNARTLAPAASKP